MTQTYLKTLHHKCGSCLHTNTLFIHLVMHGTEQPPPHARIANGFVFFLRLLLYNRPESILFGGSWLPAT